MPCFFPFVSPPICVREYHRNVFLSLLGPGGKRGDIIWRSNPRPIPRTWGIPPSSPKTTDSSAHFSFPRIFFFAREMIIFSEQQNVMYFKDVLLKKKSGNRFGFYYLTHISRFVQRTFFCPGKDPGPIQPFFPLKKEKNFRICGRSTTCFDFERKRWEKKSFLWETEFAISLCRCLDLDVTRIPPPLIAPRGGRGERGFGGTKWLQEPLQREGGGDTFKGIWVGSKRGQMVQRWKEIVKCRQLPICASGFKSFLHLLSKCYLANLSF